MPEALSLNYDGGVEKTYNSLVISHSHSAIDSYLQELSPETQVSYTRHFSQGEEFFLEFSQDFQVPVFPIHHDVRLQEPGKDYRQAFTQLLREIAPLAPGIFQGLKWFFNPSEPLRPSFYRIYKYQDTHYLFLMTLDLVFHPREGTITTKGTNDTTAGYQSRRLFVEADIFPVDQVVKLDNGGLRFDIEQQISQTWIGETGRGYFIQGIWIDRELTRFFSKLLVPRGKRIYPYYPYTCKLKTIAHTLIHLESEPRQKQIPYLAKAIEFIKPRLDEIQQSVHDNPFSEDIPTFQRYKQEVPRGWNSHWDDLKVTPYLNPDNQKEFRIDDI